VKPVRIATRGSDLALWQARNVAARIEAELGVATELVPLETTGDRLLGSLAKVGGKGLFVKEIEAALLEGRADVAVHSGKDLPALQPEGLAIAAVPRRADPRDALLARVRGASLASLPRGARVGTGSVRRGAQLRRQRGDLEIVPLRGNVGTRIEKIERESLDAVVLATAGLERLGIGERIDERIDADLLLPAVAQGALAVQAREGEGLAGDLAALEHATSRATFDAERAFLARLGGDCNVPVAAHAEQRGRALRLRALVISPDGARIASSDREAPTSDPAGLGVAAAEEVVARGGDAILAAAREASS
jgi:hydroxymethylbilane synthase